MSFEDVEFGSSKAVKAITEPAPSRAAPVWSAHTRAAAAIRPPADKPDPKLDGVLVPLDQWTNLLNQLGNLHQAGQQLAEARERAAKAETEAMFLSERLKEMRHELAEARSDGSRVEVIATPAPEAILRAAAPAAPLSQPATTDRVLIVKLPSRLTRWWVERRS